MKKSLATSRLTVPRPRAEPRSAALVYGYVTRDARQTPAILTVDRSRYADLGIEPPAPAEDATPTLEPDPDPAPAD